MWCFARETAYKRALQEALSKEDHHRQRATLLQKTIAKNFASEVLYEQFVSYICPESADTEVLEWLKKIDEVTEL